MERVLSTYLFSSQALGKEPLAAVARAGIHSIELFAAGGHFNFRSPEQIRELSHWLDSMHVSLHSVHAPLDRSTGRGRDGGAPISIAEPDKLRRIEAVDEMKWAMELAEAGVPLAEIDRAAEAFGMPMGPVELVDSVGIDVALHVSKVLGAAMNRPVPQKLADMVEAGQLGRKSGQGFYRWENGKAVKQAAAGGEGNAEVEDRLILPMINEAVACLYDGVVRDADLLDAGVIFGTGFAPFRGGPVNYAREHGVERIVARLNDLAKQYGERFAPHAGFSKI